MDDSSTASCTTSPSRDQVDEDRDLQEAIRLSKMEGPSPASGSSTASVASISSPGRLAINGKGTKRNAEDDMGPSNAKRAPASVLGMGIASSISGQTNSASFEETTRTFAAGLQSSNNRRRDLSSPNTTEAKITYPDGALRITRTPGRRNAKNCVNLGDVIQGKSLVSACAFSFFIGEEEFYDHFPLSRSSNAVPVRVHSGVCGR